MEQQQDYLLGNFERCVTSMKQRGAADKRWSIANNIAISEWQIDPNLDILRTTLESLVAQKGSLHSPHNHEQESLIISFNLAVSYFLAGESEKAKNLLFPLPHTNTMVLRFADLLSDILFSLSTHLYSPLLPFPFEWSAVVNSLTSHLKESEATPPTLAGRNYLTFRLHLLNCRYYIRNNQLKAAKKESKLAMELYNHHIKTMSHPMFAQLLAQFHKNLPEIANQLSSVIDINREIAKEGCSVHSLKVVSPSPLQALL
jgi:hypothetical protein